MSGESIFNDVESIYINNEEVQSIKRVDDGAIIYKKSMVLENPMVLTVTGSSFTTYSSTPFTYNDKVFVDWGDDTGLVEYNGGKLSHTFNDGLNSHTVKVYGDITSISSGCFIFCQGLTSIVIPNSVISLESECFKECSDLISIDIPNSITSFGTNCFQRCTSLASINIPNSAVSIGRYCFDGCTGLTSIQLNWTSNDILTYQSEWIENTNSNLKFIIPEGTKQLYIDKGYPSDKLEEPSVMILTVTGSTFSSGNSTPFTYNDKVFVDYGDGYGPFEYSGGKLSCYYSDGLNSHTVKVYGDITSLKDDCFMNWDNLTSITIPDSVTSLGDSCFRDCTGLTSITIPDSVTNLKDYCFYGCTGLTSITIPNSVTSLGYSCFDSCTGLTSVVIPNSVTSIGYYCFWGCTGLTSITIPNSVTSLGTNCFRGCTGLNDYYLNWTSSSTIIEYNSGIMPNNTNTIFHIPQNTTQLYIDKGYPSDKLKEEVIELTLEVDKNILSFNDSDYCSLTAILSSRDVGNKTIEFFNGETLLGTAVTDNNGVASITYTSQGVGDIEVYAKYGTLTSETFSIEDCIKTFKLDGTDNYRTFRGSSKSFNEGVITAKSCVAYGFENLNSFRLEFEWLGGYAIIMPSNETRIDRNWIQFTPNSGYVYINGSRNNLPTFSEPFTQTTDGFYKAIIEKDNGAYRFKVEDTVICEFTNVPSATEWAVGIDHYQTTNNKIKNIKVKPL